MKKEGKSTRSVFFLVLFVLVLSVGSLRFAAAHGEEKVATTELRWIEPTLYLELTAIWVFLLTLFILFNQKLIARKKHTFFFLMIIPLALATMYLGAHTVYDNITSITGGPVHWHADYRVFACGDEAELADPSSFSNRVGSAILHEHNDGRIHIEGTIQRFEDYTLGEYFETIGGQLTPNSIIFPTPEGVKAYRDGQRCSDETLGTLKVYINGKRIADPADHLIYPDSYVPPGDCIILLFDASSADTTSLLCESWEVQGWSYDSFKRRTMTIGGKTWQ